MVKRIWISPITTKSPLNIALDLLVLFLFSFTFFSIPAFSFIGSGKYVTWVLTLFLLLSICISLFLFYRIKLDIISLSFLLFAVSSLVSSALCGFKAFKTTPIFLSLLTFVIYTYSKSIKGSVNLNSFLFSAFIGSVLFLFFFIFKYKRELIHLDFDRIGSKFGDENDVALFLGFGLLCSFYYGVDFHKDTIIFNVFCLFLVLLFGLCGFSTGSKIFILISFLCFLYFPFAKCGKKKWWLALLINICLVAVFFALINLPFFSTIKDRFFSFISTLFGKSVGQGKTNELSTINRMDMFCCGMQMWMRKPIFGWGIWGFATFSGRAGGWSHNNISESFCNFGLIGTFLFHFGFIMSFYYFFKSRFKKERMLSFALLLFYVLMMVSVALNSQKLYAYVSGIIFASICESKNLISFRFFKKETGLSNEN